MGVFGSIKPLIKLAVVRVFKHTNVIKKYKYKMEIPLPR
jgi:hypothetical protein